MIFVLKGENRGKNTTVESTEHRRRTNNFVCVSKGSAAVDYKKAEATSSVRLKEYFSKPREKHKNQIT